jgi:ABC-type lipoprotein export system ATPase subunit
MATHSQEVIGMADRIFSLRDGKLTECPTKEAC